MYSLRFTVSSPSIDVKEERFDHAVCNGVMFAAFCVFILYWDKRTGLLHHLHPYVLYISDVVTDPTTGFTYWKIKTRNRITSNEIPQSVEMLQLHRKHSTRTARKYLSVVSLFLLPLFLCILPWYIVKVSELTDKNAILAKDVGFFWQRLSMTLVFLPGVLLPITLTIRFQEYYKSVSRYFRG